MNHKPPGPRFLMCPPQYFDTHHLFNPWMEWREAVDHDRCWEEWQALRQAIIQAGGEVELIEPKEEAGAMVFTRDAALVYAPGRVMVLQNEGPRGIVEPPVFSRWFARHGYLLESPPPGRIDGGNILRCTDGRYLIGVKPGSNLRVERYLARLLHRLTGARCTGIPLADRRYLHLDMVLADLGGRGWLVYPAGLGSLDLGHPAWQAIFGHAPVIEVKKEEAERLASNIIVVGDTVIGGYLPERLSEAIAALGLRVVVTELDEFRKAGGGAHCLTLELGPPLRSRDAEGKGNIAGEGGEDDAEEKNGGGAPPAHNG